MTAEHGRRKAFYRQCCFSSRISGFLTRPRRNGLYEKRTLGLSSCTSRVICTFSYLSNKPTSARSVSCVTRDFILQTIEFNTSMSKRVPFPLDYSTTMQPWAFSIFSRWLDRGFRSNILPRDSTWNVFSIVCPWLFETSVPVLNVICTKRIITRQSSIFSPYICVF